jgi:hypothetical protein
MDMKKIQAYSQSDLTAKNGGVRPDLYPIIQDGAGLYTGQVAYSFTGGLHLSGQTPTNVGDLLSTSLTNGNSMSSFTATHYDDGTTKFPVVYDGGFNTYYGGSDAVDAIASGGIAINLPSSVPSSVSTANKNLLAAVCWNKTYYVLFSANGSAYIMTAAPGSPTQFPQYMNAIGATFAQINTSGVNGVDLSQGHGWATESAAILSSHSDNGNLLTAFSWSGSKLGSTRLNISNNNDNSSAAAYEFHPDGQYWFVYDPSNGRLSKYKAWW